MPKSRRVKIIETIEPWAIAKLEDGTTIKAKLVFTGAHLILKDDGTPDYNPDGSPQYACNHHQVLVIEAYEEVPEGTLKS